MLTSPYPVPELAMTADLTALKEAAKQQNGCGMQEALDAMPWAERLQAVRDLRQSLGASPPVNIEIAEGSTSDHYAYRITSAKADLSAIAKELNLPPDTLKGLENAPGARAGRLLASESYDFNLKLNQTGDGLNLKFKLGFHQECH
jgi:hypothetical protein